MTLKVWRQSFLADFESQNYQYTTTVDLKQYVQLTTSTAIEPNACYVLPIFS
jgi:hypothetical protein